MERELKENGQRFCDVCNEEIPKGAKYQRSQMPAQAADLLSGSRDPDLIPTWTTNVTSSDSSSLKKRSKVSTSRAKNTTFIAPGERLLRRLVAVTKISFRPAISQ